jgi:class 3 adenylate cyclase/TolB-like protein/tetratricopeptide (TPR) repeat protein/rhodanese-related sulfurtransferase
MSGSNASDLAGKLPDQRKLIAVIYADMVGYSRLIGLDDGGTLDRLRTLRRNLIDPAINEHGGRIVQTGGDSLLIVFDSIDGAVRCAVKVQQQVPIHDSDQPPDRAIRFRIGINIGDAIADGTDLHGDAVNVVARLQAECPPGGICVSRSVRDHVHGRLELTFEELGPLDLKNIVRPVEAFVVHNRSEPPAVPTAMFNVEPPARLSLVVLPFRNLGSKSDEDHLADAITQDLTIELARIPGVLVIAHTSGIVKRDGPIDIKRIGEELRVRYAVEGVVQKLGDKMRVGVKLIATATNQQIWAERFDENIEDLVADHDGVVRRISSMLDSRILDAETAIGVRERTANPNALDLLLRAWSLFKRPANAELLKQTTELLEHALQLEPSSVPAMLSLADRLIHRYVSPDTTDWGNIDLIDQVAVLLSRAEMWAPNDEWLAYFKASSLRACGRWREASLLLQRLVASYPNNYAGHWMLARCAMIMGRSGDAITLLKETIRHKPLSQSNRLAHWMIGNCLLLQGDAAEAIDWLERGLSETPEAERRSKGQQNLYLASAHALVGNTESAVRALSEANLSWPFGTMRSLWPFYEPRGLPGPVYSEQIQRVQEGLRLAGLREYADETTDFGAAPIRSLWPDPVGWTPTCCPGAMTIRTPELVRLLEERSPVLVDVALGSWGKSLPGAVGLQGTGHGAEFSERVQNRFAHKIIDLTKNDLAVPMVVFCRNSERFTAYNLVLRLISLGCTTVYWYRGGFEAWLSNNLPSGDLVLQDW